MSILAVVVETVVIGLTVVVGLGMKDACTGFSFVGLPGDSTGVRLGQQTPGTNKLLKQID